MGLLGGLLTDIEEWREARKEWKALKKQIEWEQSQNHQFPSRHATKREETLDEILGLEEKKEPDYGDYSSVCGSVSFGMTASQFPQYQRGVAPCSASLISPNNCTQISRTPCKLKRKPETLDEILGI